MVCAYGWSTGIVVDHPKFNGEFKPIHIGHHVWIGTGATILQSVTLGDGAVVTKDVDS